jgi:hypothetical protein
MVATLDSWVDGSCARQIYAAVVTVNKLTNAGESAVRTFPFVRAGSRSLHGDFEEPERGWGGSKTPPF